MVYSFDEFLNEELNIQRFDNGICRFEDRWFFYDPDDEIVYGSDNRPGDVADGFSFNPVECIVVTSDGDIRYGKGSMCMISYDMDEGETLVREGDFLLDWLKGYDIEGIDLNSRPDDVLISGISDIFDSVHEQGVKNMLIWGDQLIASTFDVIEEN